MERFLSGGGGSVSRAANECVWLAGMPWRANFPLPLTAQFTNF